VDVNPSRRLAAWALPRSALVADVLAISAERDKWERTAMEAKRIADEAVSVARRYAEQLEAEQSRNASLAADLDRLVFHG
jgi:signal transduction histidine kinase